jgi:hypothetical protein
VDASGIVKPGKPSAGGARQYGGAVLQYGGAVLQYGGAVGTVAHGQVGVFLPAPVLTVGGSGTRASPFRRPGPTIRSGVKKRCEEAV